MIEADSPSHNPAYDAERDRIFAKHHVLVLRFNNEEINSDLPSVLNRIREALRKRLNGANSL